jgi:uncharacterized membrane protein YedE/YeeE
MGKNLSALIAGLVFGLGLTISQMVNPEKVLGFLDVLGNWDPSLAFVMAGAIAVTFLGYRLVWRLKEPIFSDQFERPANRQIDRSLMSGSVLFGAGWGLVGLCPGPAIVAVTLGGWPSLGFLAAMLTGMGLFELSSRLGDQKAPV